MDISSSAPSSSSRSKLLPSGLHRFGLIDGEVVDVTETALPLEDRAQLYGDGIFTTMRVTGGRVELLDRHLERLRDSCRIVGIAHPPDKEIVEGIERLLDANGVKETAGRVSIVRKDGRGLRGGSSGSLRIVLRPLPPEMVDPVAVITLSLRFQPPRIMPRVKAIDYLSQIVTWREIGEKGGDEGIFLQGRGIMEGTMSNVAQLLDGKLVTAPPTSGVLEGIMMREVVALAKRTGMGVVEEGPKLESVREEGGLFLTNSVRGIMPVGTLDGIDLPQAPDLALLRRELGRSIGAA